MRRTLYAGDIDEDEVTSESLTRIRAEMERYVQRQREAQEETSSTARSDSDEVDKQSIPAGFEFHRMDTGGTDDLPPLIDIPTEVRLQQPSSSSSGTLKDIVSGAKAGVETLAKAGATAIAKSILPV